MDQIIPKKGDIIQLTEPMENDPNPIQVGDKGEVLAITPIGHNEIQIVVDWESGRKLHLIHPVDKFKIIKKS